jgi:hypothetical protein
MGCGGQRARDQRLGRGRAGARSGGMRWWAPMTSRPALINSGMSPSNATVANLVTGAIPERNSALCGVYCVVTRGPHAAPASRRETASSRGLTLRAAAVGDLGAGPHRPHAERHAEPLPAAGASRCGAELRRARAAERRDARTAPGRRTPSCGCAGGVPGARTLRASPRDEPAPFHQWPLPDSNRHTLASEGF